MKVNKLSESTFKFYTDGVKTIRVKDGETPPDGFRPGRTFNSNPWNKGKTADTDDRVRAGALKGAQVRRDNGSYDTSWNKGLTKDNNEIMAATALKVSTSTMGRVPWNKGVHASDEQKKKQSDAMRGHIPYNKGLTKETSPSLMSASKKLLGHKCFVTDWEATKQKEYATKKLRGTFNSSNPEKELISKLIEIFGEDDVIHPYRDSRYPYNCDAYIKSIDLFVEFNGTIEHNRRPFNPDDASHIKEVEEFTARAERLGGNNRYWNIIKWWTVIDPMKLETLRKNNLNFVIIYPNNLIIDK